MMTLLEEENIAETSRGIPQDSFTTLDFVRVFRALCSEDWRRLVERFGEFGEKRRCTVATYPSNRLDSYSQKPDSLLIPPPATARTSSGTMEELRKRRGGSSSVLDLRFSRRNNREVGTEEGRWRSNLRGCKYLRVLRKVLE
ncbi:MAG: hypothetical protein LN412_04700 [Candidatus Thermoplasmatota archaeon]|nr:hypothetical protein [Candidatus Thermoplasmatota archaeon]